MHRYVLNEKARLIKRKDARRTGKPLLIKENVMDNFRYTMAVDALKGVKARFDYDKLQEVADIIDGANNVFVAGRGRSRQTAMNFGSRLSQMGKNVYVVGAANAPSIKEGDVLVLSSGSGSTPTLVDFAKTAAEVGAKCVLLTMNKDAEVSKINTASFLVSDVNRQEGTGEDSEIYSKIYAYPTNLGFETILTYIMMKNGLSREEVDAQKPNLF
jgi:6-phospho-3-hexuloisomerase